MAAFRPEPTESPTAIANWLFVRLAVLFAAASYGTIVFSSVLPSLEFVYLVVNLVFLWGALLLLFEALDVFLEAKLDGHGNDAGRRD